MFELNNLLGHPVSPRTLSLLREFVCVWRRIHASTRLLLLLSSVGATTQKPGWFAPPRRILCVGDSSWCARHSYYYYLSQGMRTRRVWKRQRAECFHQFRQNCLSLSLRAPAECERIPGMDPSSSSGNFFFLARGEMMMMTMRAWFSSEKCSGQIPHDESGSDVPRLFRSFIPRHTSSSI